MSRPEIFRISDKIPSIVPAELTHANTGRVVMVAPSWQASWHQCSLTDGYSGTPSRSAGAESRSALSGCQHHRGVVELEELHDTAVTEGGEIGLRSIEVAARLPVAPGRSADHDDSIAVHGELLGLVVDHLPVFCEPGEGASDVVRRMAVHREFEAGPAGGQGPKSHVFREQGGPHRRVLALALVPAVVGVLQLGDVVGGLGHCCPPLGEY